MIGILVVSHSHQLAEGVVELAREMGGDDLSMVGVGGLDTPGRPLGTDPARILAAIERVYSEDGVLVLMDLGSALLSAEMALELLPPEKAEKVLLCAAPLVEGALAAAVQARLGASVEEVAAEARSALDAKIAHLGAPAPGSANQPLVLDDGGDGQEYTLRLKVSNRLGLHARPAARFVQTAGRFPEAKIRVRNQTTGAGPVSARSINGVTTLGVRQGHEISIGASGYQAQAALDALGDLVARNFDDQDIVQEEEDHSAPAALSGEENPSSVMLNGSEDAVPGVLVGLPVSPGIAIGPLNHFRPAVPEVTEEQIDDPQAAWHTFKQAIRRTRAQIRVDLAAASRRTGRYTAAIFDAHLLFLEDEALLSPTRAAIFDRKINPAAAWMQMVERVAAQYWGLDDPYLQTRARDVEEVGARVLMNLLGAETRAPTFEGLGILAAPDLPTAEMAHLDPSNVWGILTAFGGPNSHAAILARALGIPAVAGLGERVLNLEEGTLLVIDGEKGMVWVDPDPEPLANYRRQSLIAEEKRQKALAESREAAVTRDGHRIEVVANISIPTEAMYAVDSGAEGVGVFRTEYLFLGREEAPGEDEQAAAYRTAAIGLAGRPLIVRTLDAGGDKAIPYLNLAQEANPFLGWRGLRLCLGNPELFKTQLRAIIRVAAEFPVKMMFPMVSTLDEWRAARDLLDQAARELSERGLPVPEKIETGIMVEVPSAALLAEAFAEEVDFFSIGTNDLTQYLLAAERGNPKVAHLSDALHPAVLQMIERVVEAAHARGKWVGVCGEMAGDPQAIPVLVGLGVDELSMNAPAIPRAKQIIRGLDEAQARAQARAALGHVS